MLLNYHIGLLVLSSLCVGDLVRFAGWSTNASACKPNTTQNQPHEISNTQRAEKKTTDVVIPQHRRRLLKMDILRSETCWGHKNWNKTASDIKLVFHSSFHQIYWCPHRRTRRCVPEDSKLYYTQILEYKNLYLTSFHVLNANMATPLAAYFILFGQQGILRIFNTSSALFPTTRS